MEKLRLRDLKPFIRLLRNKNFHWKKGDYVFDFYCYLPILSNDKILVPFRYNITLDKVAINSKSMSFWKDALIRQITEEIYRTIIFYDYKQYVFDNKNLSVGELQKEKIPVYMMKHVMNLETLRKMFYEYLAR